MCKISLRNIRCSGWRQNQDQQSWRCQRAVYQTQWVQRRRLSDAFGHLENCRGHPVFCAAAGPLPTVPMVQRRVVLAGMQTARAGFQSTACWCRFYRPPHRGDGLELAAKGGAEPKELTEQRNEDWATLVQNDPVNFFDQHTRELLSV